MKAREPDRTGVVQRDGVHVAWQVYGDLLQPDDPAVLLLPTWCLLPAEVWKLQVPFLARRTRVVTFDPRGNGLSDRPSDPSAYGRAALSRDAVDVLDATGTSRAVVVGFSAGNAHALDLAVDHPGRVAAWVAISPSIVGLGGYPEERATRFESWDQDLGVDEGWARYNKHSWLRDYRGFTEFFCDQIVSEPHSTKLVEDLLRWSTTTDGETLVTAQLARRAGRPTHELCTELTCPVVVVHGTDDRVTPHSHGVRLAELTGGELVSFEGSGHMPHGRDPVAANRLIDRVLAAAGADGLRATGR